MKAIRNLPVGRQASLSGILVRVTCPPQAGSCCRFYSHPEVSGRAISAPSGLKNNHKAKNKSL